MTRQSISFTPPNNDWLNSQVKSQEYKNKSDVVNDLIRKARAQQNEIELIRAKLIKAERSGFVEQTKDEILSEFKKELKHEHKL